MLEFGIRYERGGCGGVFVVVWCAMRAVAGSFSLWFLCLFVGLDCHGTSTVADKRHLSVISGSDDCAFQQIINE
jgi:hypothetical protein